MIYAQINSEKICIGISRLTGKVENPLMIELTNYDTELLGKKLVDGQWVEVLAEDTQPQPLSEAEKANIAIMEALADSYEQGLKREEQNLAILEGMAGLYETVAPQPEGSV